MSINLLERDMMDMIPSDMEIAHQAEIDIAFQQGKSHGRNDSIRRKMNTYHPDLWADPDCQTHYIRGYSLGFYSR
jgi:hypothetical protein